MEQCDRPSEVGCEQRWAPKSDGSAEEFFRLLVETPRPSGYEQRAQEAPLRIALGRRSYHRRTWQRDLFAPWYNHQALDARRTL